MTAFGFNGQLDGVSLQDLTRTGLAPGDVSRFAAQVIGVNNVPLRALASLPLINRESSAAAGCEHRGHGRRAGRDGGALSAARRAATQRPVSLQPHRGIRPARRSRAP